MTLSLQVYPGQVSFSVKFKSKKQDLDWFQCSNFNFNEDTCLTSSQTYFVGFSDFTSNLQMTLQNPWERSGSMVGCLTRDRASLHCGP